MTESKKKAVIVVDHGSLREPANDLLWGVVDLLSKTLPECIVEGAHMELAPPNIDEVIGEVVSKGAKTIVIHPYMLAPGRHATEDIPRMAKEAVSKYKDIELFITDPLGIDQNIIDVIASRCEESLKAV